MNWLTIYLTSLAVAIAVIIAVFIYGRRMQKVREKRAQRNRLLLDIAQMMNASLDPDQILETAVEQMVALFDVDHSGIVYFEEDQRIAHVVAEYPPSGALERILPMDNPLNERLTADREPVVIEDTWNDPLVAPVRETAKDLKIRSMLLVPLVVREDVVGSIGLDAIERQRHFTDEEVSFAQTVANQVALAMENARLYEQERQRAQQASLLNVVAQHANQLLTPDVLLPRTAEAIQRSFGYDAILVMLINHETSELVIQGKAGPCADLIPSDYRQSLDQGIIGWVARHAEPLMINDTSQDARYFAPFPDRYQASSEMAVPLKIGGETVGVLDLQCQAPNEFDELSLATAKTLAEQISTALQNARLYEETQRRAVQLEAAAEVARSATGILDVDELLDETVHLISDTFGFYHAGVFMVDEAGDYAVLHAASSEGGQRILREGHRLTIGEVGIVGYVTATGEPRIALDVGEDAVHFANPHLPETRSEMALPLISRGEIIGALDVQSIRQAAFTEDDVSVLQTMADQLANAIKNAQLFETTSRRVAELEAARQASLHLTSTLELQPTLEVILKHAIQLVAADDAHVFLYDDDQLHFGAARWAGEIQRQPYAEPRSEGLTYSVARSGERIVIPAVEQNPLFQNGTWDDWHGAIIGLPLIVGDQVRGVMNLAFDEPHPFTEEEIRALELLADQAAVAIENARLFEETKRRLDESRLLQQVMQAAASTLDFDEVLARTIKTLHSTLNIEYLSFGQPDNRQAAMVIHPSRIGYPPPKESPWRLPMDASILGRVYRSGEPVLLQDVRQAPDYFEVASDVQSELAVPVRVGNEVIGVLNAESVIPAAFDEDDQRLFSAIAAQLGMVLENAQLYQQLQRRQEELSQTYEELRELDRLRTEMVQNVNHEIRTPFSLIQGYLELLLDEDLGPLKDEQRDALATIRERTAKLASLIQNLSTLEKVPREQPRFAAIPLIDVLQHTLIEFKHLARQAGLRVREDLPSGLPLTRGDREQLALVFGHLMDNAIKFSPEGGTITIRAWADDAWTYVSVADEGIGIASEHLDRIFERFYQVDGSTTRRFGGMGLGLALVWEIVEAHGGAVTVDSELEEGSTFTVKLPQANSFDPQPGLNSILRGER